MYHNFLCDPILDPVALRGYQVISARVSAYTNVMCTGAESDFTYCNSEQTGPFHTCSYAGVNCSMSGNMTLINLRHTMIIHISGCWCMRKEDLLRFWKLSPVPVLVEWFNHCCMQVLFSNWIGLSMKNEKSLLQHHLRLVLPIVSKLNTNFTCSTNDALQCTNHVMFNIMNFFSNSWSFTLLLSTVEIY